MQRIYLLTLVMLQSFFCFNYLNSQLIASPIQVSDITTTGFKLSWENTSVANSFIRHGHTPNLELGILNAGPTTNPVIEITNAQPSQLYYVQAVAQFGGDLDQTDTLVFITQSNSTGKINTYFNQSVDQTVALPGNEAVHTPNSIDDTLVKYILMAQESIDVAVYNTTSSSAVADIAGALNTAHANGVQVRVIYNENTGNTAIPLLSPGIPRLESPPADFNNNIGIMHHKFFVFDANANNPNLPRVWTGSTNLTTQQVNTDANHAVLIQDQSLAIAYWLEFNEMWGSDGFQPNPQNAKFGIQKKDNTPHVFNVNGIKVESYFSPSDNTNQRIVEAIYEANTELLVNTMLITMNSLADAIIFQHFNGVNTAVLVNTESQSSTFGQLRNTLKGRLAEYSGITGILHHKTMMTDVLSNQNPLVLTGSHNWSASADNINDENTIIIYDEMVVNQFFQEFMARFEPMASQVEAIDDQKTVYGETIHILDVSENDNLYFTIVPTTSIVHPPANGIANGSNLGVISYLPNTGYLGIDSLMYRTCNHTIKSYCDSAWVYIQVEKELSTVDVNVTHNLNIFPNPAKDKVELQSDLEPIEKVIVRDVTGKVIGQDQPNSYTMEFDVSTWNNGVYFISVTIGDKTANRKIVVAH
ncbi:MAG: T9SS type A sorting domain-containing protein [Crocinitomicaceae bacterium]|nr:T9SS type A sorting domain-containing protein [Crocinitomicaceae bacterium]